MEIPVKPRSVSLRRNSSVAERRTCNALVRGPIPRCGTKIGIMNTLRIPVDRLLFKPNAPCGMNPLVLMSLTYMLRSNVVDPEPIVVRVEGEYYRIMDGRHRAMGAIVAGRPDVLATIET